MIVALHIPALVRMAILMKEKQFVFVTNVLCHILECSYKCLKCSGSSTGCDSCDTISTNRVDDSGTSHTCPCAETYYDDSSNTNCASNTIYHILACSYKCVLCSGSATGCDSCDITSTNRIDDSGTSHTCPCSDGYFDDGENANCASNYFYTPYISMLIYM
jgi:hypothetical protein